MPVYPGAVMVSAEPPSFAPFGAIPDGDSEEDAARLTGVWFASSRGCRVVMGNAISQGVLSMKRFGSFGELARYLSEREGETFQHVWQNPSYRNSLPTHMRRWLKLDYPGQSGKSEVPRFLYRGEAGLFKHTFPGIGRVIQERIFSRVELSLLFELSKLSMRVHTARLSKFDPQRAECWAQHYGIPTSLIDLTSDPRIALHFAADTQRPVPSNCVVYRIDLRAIERKVYGPAGLPTPLSAANLAGTYFTRAVRQKAWFIRSNRRNSHRFDLQHSWDLGWHIERFKVAPQDREAFRRPDLLTAEDDSYASWPLALVRALKIIAGGGLKETLARYLCYRLPLFEWTPVRVQFDDRGREMGRYQLTPAQAKQETGRDYEADKQTIIDELVSPNVDRPNCLLFGVLRGGPAGGHAWIHSGDECQIQWLRGVEGPHLWTREGEFDRVVLR
jgi:hypothetical protein